MLILKSTYTVTIIYFKSKKKTERLAKQKNNQAICIRT